MAPGLVDLHTHLRQPGGGGSRDGRDGRPGRGAGRVHGGGGDAQHAIRPSTARAVALEVLGLGATALCRVAVAGAITVGRAGERLAPMAELAALGVRLFTDDGTGVQDAGVMRRALDYATGPRGDARPSTARTPSWPPAVTCTKGRGRAGWAFPACPRRPRR